MAWYKNILGCSFLTCKALGLATFAFCLGAIVGLFFPIAIVAVVETIMLLFLAYLCIFHW